MLRAPSLEALDEIDAVGAPALEALHDAAFGAAAAAGFTFVLVGKLEIDAHVDGYSCTNIKW